MRVLIQKASGNEILITFFIYLIEILLLAAQNYQNPFLMTNKKQESFLVNLEQ